MTDKKPEDGGAAAFIVHLREIMIQHQQTGTADKVILVCVTRMAACIAMDLGMSVDQFAPFAIDQYAKVPLVRKPSNVIPIKRPSGS